MADCIKRIVELSKGTLTEKQAKKLLDDLEQSAKGDHIKGKDFNDAVLQRAIDMQNNIKINTAREKQNAYANLTKYKQTIEKVDSFIASGLTVKEAVRAHLLGTEENIKSGRMSVSAAQMQLAENYIGGFIANLEKEDLLAIHNGGHIQRQVAQELWELSTPNGKVGISKIPEAVKIAEIVNKFQTVAKERANRAGAMVGDLAGYIVRQSHDAYKLRKAGYEAWRDSILPRLDAEKTFNGADPEEFLKGAYNGIITGIHLKPTSEKGEKLFAFKGPSNLAKKMSTERVLHFKGANEWFDYNTKFGSGDLNDSIQHGLELSGKNTALMEMTGTNPNAMHEKVISTLTAKYRDDARAMKGFSDNSLAAYMAQVDGTVNFADSPSLGMWGGVVRATQSMAHLGGAAISSITDLATMGSEIQFQGKTWLESRVASYGSLFEGRGSSEKKQIASLIGVGTDGLTGSVVSRFSGNDSLPGTMSKMQRMFFKLNGLTWWTDTRKISVGMMMSHELATVRGSEWGRLSSVQRDLFGLYDISESDWNHIRRVDTKDLEGRAHITPDAVQHLDGLTAREKDSLESKLQAYYIDRVNHAVISPDNRESVILNAGLQRGTPMGEAVRFFTQFKAFPVSFVNKVIGKSLYARGRRDVPMLLGLMAELTVLGYIAMSAKDLLKGKEARDPRDKATWAASFIQGGGAGIYGDFLMGEKSRGGKGFLETLGGPTIGAANDVWQLYTSVRDGDDAKAKALSTVINNTPYANLFYVRPALNHLFIYQLQESLNPGYLGRVEDRIKKDNNQEFWLKPSESVR